MKRTVLVFGVLSGVVSSLLMIATIQFVDSLGDKGAIAGYTGLVLAFLLVFFGVRSYRDQVGGGVLTVGRGLAVGLLITLISSAFYVATWEVLYFKFLPGFGDKMAAMMVDQARASGASPEVLAAKEQEAKAFKEMYNRPLMNIALTFTEPLPVGLAMTLLSAVALRRRTPAPTRA